MARLEQKIIWDFKLPIQPFLKPTWLLLKRERERTRRRHQRQRRVWRKNPGKYERGLALFASVGSSNQCNFLLFVTLVFYSFDLMSVMLPPYFLQNAEERLGEVGFWNFRNWKILDLVICLAIFFPFKKIWNIHVIVELSGSFAYSLPWSYKTTWPCWKLKVQSRVDIGCESPWNLWKKISPADVPPIFHLKDELLLIHLSREYKLPNPC